MNQKSDKVLYLLDGMALIYRAFFAFQNNPIRNSRGENNSALFGFLNTLMDILEKRSPTHIAVAFDTMAPTFRHEIYPAYKEQRESMPEDLASALPRAKELLAAFRIHVLELDGFEADDIIGTLAWKAAEHGFEVIMVSPDKDFAQLVRPGVRIYRPGRQGGEVEIYDEKLVCEKWQISRPSQVVDVLGLWGDASDNIPGVPGIGEKTAAKLISQYDSIEGVLNSIQQLKGKQKENLEKFSDQARLSRRLAEIHTQVPIPIAMDELEVRNFDGPALKKFLIDHEFNTLGKRIFGDDFKAGRGFLVSGQSELFTESAEHGGLIPAIEPTLLTLQDIPHDFAIVRTLPELQSLLRRLKNHASLCFDTETSSLDAFDAELLGIAWSEAAGKGGYIALSEAGEENGLWIAELQSFFHNDSMEWIGHNLKFDMHVLETHGIKLSGRLFDTMIAHALIDPEQRHGMDFLSESYLGYSPIPISELIGADRKSQISMKEVPVDKVAEYAAEDAEVTFRLAQVFRKLIDEKGATKVFYEVEMPLLPVLVRMERTGVAVDAEALQEISLDLASSIQHLEQRIYEKAGVVFNLNSPKQLGKILFEDLQVTGKAKKTRTGQYATNESVLQSLAGTHPIVADILDYRGLTKLKSTYVDTLPTHIRSDTGRVHTSYGQAMTSTGRLQSQDPNLQNIPIRSEEGREIRRAFVAAGEGCQLMSADYSQIELRIIAALSQDKSMRQAFMNKEDIHSATASRVYGVPLAEVNATMRRNAKMVNFGIAYGITAFGLAQRLGISRTEAGEIIEHYFKQFPGIRGYLDSTLEFARRHGYVETVLGRRRQLPDINSANATVRSAAERNAINTPIQGTAADMIKLAMVRIHQRLRNEHFKSELLLQVHDELVFEVREEEMDRLKSLVLDCMVHAIELDVPIEVETGIGPNWLIAH